MNKPLTFCLSDKYFPFVWKFCYPTVIYIKQISLAKAGDYNRLNMEYFLASISDTFSHPICLLCCEVSIIKHYSRTKT